MSKKRKNSNYKQNTEIDTTAADRRKNRIILFVCLSIVAAIVLATVAAIVLIPDKTDVMGTGSCAYVETRDIDGREISYVEFKIKDHGRFVVLVDATTAPKTVVNFLSLVKDGFYNGLTIFRAQEGFVIQGGRNDNENLTPIAGEFSSNGHENDISHIRGVISMARTNDPDSATSQFFITLHDSATYSLDGRYAAFGYVVEGMSVVDTVAEALLQCDSDSYGFVSNDDAITIVSAKVLENYK